MTSRLPLLILTVLSLALAGCSSPEEAESPTPTTPTPTSPTPTPTTPTTPTPDDGSNGAPPGGNVSGALLNESFERGFAGWTNHTDGAAGAGEWTFDVTSTAAHDGTSSLRIAYEGGSPSGAAWITREIQVPGRNATTGATNGTGAGNATGNGGNGTNGGSAGMALNLSVWVHGAMLTNGTNGGSNATSDTNDTSSMYVLLWVGTTEPMTSAQFDTTGGASTHSGVRIPLRELQRNATGSDGWERYSLEWATPLPDTGSMYVAAGILVEDEGGAGGRGAEFHFDHIMLEFSSMS